MKLYNKKGISPLIATVLVIGFTIVLAGVVMQFIMPLFVQSGEKAKSDAALMRMCSDFGVSLAVKSAVYNAVGADPSTQPESFNVVVDNPTSVPIQDLTIKYYLKDGSAVGCKVAGGSQGATPAVDSNDIVSVKSSDTLMEDCNTKLKTITLTDITQVEVTPSVWVADTKEVKVCNNVVASAKV